MIIAYPSYVDCGIGILEVGNNKLYYLTYFEIDFVRTYLITSIIQYFILLIAKLFKYYIPNNDNN